MKVVILAGGYGTRLSEETDIKPKPMVEIGNKPILWHIMKIYSHYGYNDFLILLGYKGYQIKEYFSNYFLHQSDVTFDLLNKKMTVHNNSPDLWKVTLIDTGIKTQTGGRVKVAQKYLGNEPFMLTYGDGVADINISELEKFHRQKGKLLTMTSVQPEGRYGRMEISDNGDVVDFVEKPKDGGAWINGGFMVCEPALFDYIDGDMSVLEKEVMERIILDKSLCAFKHTGYWRCMDTMRDKIILNNTWEGKNPPWKVWKS